MVFPGFDKKLKVIFNSSLVFDDDLKTTFNKKRVYVISTFEYFCSKYNKVPISLKKLEKMFRSYRLSHKFYPISILRDLKKHKKIILIGHDYLDYQIFKSLNAFLILIKDKKCDINRLKFIDLNGVLFDHYYYGFSRDTLLKVLLKHF